MTGFITRGGMPPEAFMELFSSSDRAVAIVGGAMVEQWLQEALVAQMHRDGQMTKLLFRTNGALGSFATKIDLGFLVGIYGAEARRDLVTIKDIRNKFAHRFTISSFDTPPIKDLCMNLALVEKYSLDRDDVERIRQVPTGHPWLLMEEKLAEKLSKPRDRFILALSGFSQGLSRPEKIAMPSPIF